MASEWREEKINVGGTDLLVVRGGKGKPLLVLHEELGHPGWLQWHSEMARERELIIPIQPGFYRTERVDWIANIRDLAGFYGRVARELKLTPLDVIGFSTGGWIDSAGPEYVGAGPAVVAAGSSAGAVGAARVLRMREALLGSRRGRVSLAMMLHSPEKTTAGERSRRRSDGKGTRRSNERIEARRRNQGMLHKGIVVKKSSR